MLRRRFISERVRKEHRRRIGVRMLLWLFLAIGIFFLLVEFVNLKYTRIQKISIEGNSAIADREIFDTVISHLGGSYAHIFSRRNIFIYPHDALVESLTKEFVRIEEVSIDRVGLHSIRVRITERSPQGLWCSAVSSMSTVCYFVDQSALAYARAPNVSGNSLITYTRTFPERVIGKRLTDQDDFALLHQAIDALETLGFRTRSVLWTSDSLDLSVRRAIDDGGFTDMTLRFPHVPPFDTAVSNLTSIMQSETTEDPIHLESIDYIDLRFENKVFYKKSEEQSEGESNDSE